MTDVKRPNLTILPALHTFTTGSIVRCIAAAVLVLSIIAVYRWAPHKVLARTCVPPSDPGLLADDATDVHAVDEYKAAVGRMLQQERFEQLDCLADSLRRSKERFAGGMWKLHIFYSGLEAPLLHPTPQDWDDHINRLKHWQSANRKSLTARVALAESYLGYAWYARGEGTSDTVSESGWQLFGHRAEEARNILQKASTLDAADPEWYVAMESVSLAQGWDREQARTLLEQAINAEPGYYYVYRMHALYLLPKWYGEDGDTELFAERMADRLGGEQGDAVYFQIAGFLVCNCNDQPQLSHMSWPRIQSGFAALEKQYGTSLTNLNLLAQMAVKLKDAVVADKAFQRIGEQWSESSWRTQSYFESSRNWASQVAPSMTAKQSIEAEVAANLATAEGTRYQAAFEKSFATLMHQCAPRREGDDVPFEMLVQVGPGGTVKGMMSDTSTAVSVCLFQKLMNSEMTHAAPFPPPPQAPYWVRLNLSPPPYSASLPPQ